jgi:hypothetical protein
MRLAEIGLLVAFVFAIFLAAYFGVCLLLASMLLNTLHLPVSHFTSGPFTPDSHKDKLDQVYSLASRDDLMNVFWLWFGHYHVPLDVFFLLVATLGIMLAVSPPHNPGSRKKNCD